ncbi:hypothetical protein B5E56_01610 [Flavonifractor sp. An112]|uniref:hypothetical protein n=1 Tax=Flavonifractor sp. An112 TaxID=1965544 RepID=UPI000B38EF20|nr:hypothetical protein [Flavonifractor sp. An112]OUQ61428.1 hypothetical protein B5E56_01610 [Flavonifractor sp. An112]
MSYIGAGKLDQHLEVLELRETSAGLWEWVAVRRAWGQVEQTAKTNLFSKVGVGARDAAIVLRTQPLTLHNALRWKGQHLFLTSVTYRDRNHLDVAAALVELVECRADADERGDGTRFPGVLTEKYAKWDQPEPYSVNQLTYVLVTPKGIVLQRGGLVAVAGTNYEVQVAHTLDPYKNEYEIVRTEDL